MPKVLCPYHADNDPSMEVYPDGSRHCFVCWKHDVGQVEAEYIPEAKEPEDLEKSLEYIRSLPYKKVREITLKSNNLGYFVVWPKGDYYKYRSYNGEPRYRAPRGHSQPLFSFTAVNGATSLVIVEGELNALSLVESCIAAIVSPGPAGNFISHKNELITIAKQYSNVLVWADADGPGIKAIWEIAPYIKDCITHISHQDANDILQSHGVGGLQKYVGGIFNGQ